jgi:hypothetical protein
MPNPRYFSGGRKVRFIDPATIQAIIAAASAVAGYLQHKATEDALKEANDKLDIVIGLCIAILEQLKNIRIVIREEVEAAFRTNDIRQLRALKKNTQDLIAAVKDPNHIPSNIQRQLELKFGEVTTLTYKLQDYGYAPYAAVAAGSLLSLQIGSLLQLEKSTLVSVLNNMRKYFSDALIYDPRMDPKTVRTTLEETKVEEANRWQYVISFPRRGYLGGHIWDLPDGDTGFTAYYLTLTGVPPEDKRSGFRFGADDPEADESVHVEDERGWPKYPSLIPGMSDNVGHMDGARDGHSLVGLRESVEIDCYFTETGATVVTGASHH